MSLAEQKRAVERIFREVNDGQRYELLDQLVAEEMIIHSPVPVPAQGREGFRQLLTFFRASFPVQRTAIHALVAEGDLVAVHHTHHVTHGGVFLGLPPTGKEIAVDGLELFRFAGGQIVEFWHNDDMLGLFQQLGLVPGA
jgi:predicted ester cyclase